MHVRIALLVALIFGAPAQAAVTPEVARYLAAARGLYELLEYERALDQVEQARTARAQTDDDIQISLYEGIIDFEIGKRDEAATALNNALLLDPKVSLPLRVSPKLEAEFESLRSSIAARLSAAGPIPAAAPPPPPAPVVAPVPTPAPAPELAAPTGCTACRWLWLPIGIVGVGGIAAGVGLKLDSKSKFDSLNDPTLARPQDSVATRDQGKLEQSAAYVCLAVGAALAATSVVLLITRPPATASVVVAPVNGGAMVVVGATFP